jgi:cell division transport system permease protein
MRAKFVLTEAATGLWRNVTMTTAMIITTAISLTLLGGGALMYQKVDKTKELLFANVEVTVFLKDNITEEQRDSLAERIKGDNLVLNVHHESKDEALSRFQQLFRSSPELVRNVKAEALPESFRVKLKDPTEFAQIRKRYGTGAGVDHVQDQQDLLGDLFKMIDGIQLTALVIALLAAVAALLLIANTIQVAAYNRRREIGIMKLVGASNWYVRLPFILESATAGLIGALLATGMLSIGKVLLVDHALAPLFKSEVVPKLEWIEILAVTPLLMGLAMLVASVAGWATLRFYVKV